MSQPIVIERRVECAADVCTTWRIVTNTDRLNRAAGMKPLSLTPVSDQSAARYLARTVLGGFDVTFEEPPFEWREFESFESIRKLRSGPATEVRTRFDFSPLTTGSRVDVRVSVVPRIGLLRPIVRIAAGQSVAKVVRAIETLEGARPDAPRRRPHVANAETLALARAALGKSDAEIVARLVAFVDEADDGEVARIRPYELASAWGLDRTRVLSTCLEAVGAGLLDLKWDIICPSCRTAADRVPKLEDLPSAGHCQLCELSFDMDLERAVEATFAPHPSIRPTPAGPYCIGGPARTPHVFSQALVAAGGQVALKVPAAPGEYKLFVRGGATARVRVEEGAAACVDVAASDGIDRAVVHVAPSGEVRVENRTGGDRHAKIERTDWLDASATAHEVSLLGVFRRQFSTEVLRTGTVMRVSKVGLLFTDLTASTALYSRAGDAAAYTLVHEHFELVGGIVEKHRGAVVKTIGDAVMAAFPGELDGLSAAREILEAFARFRQTSDLCEDVFLKLGYFAGSSFVVSANHALDYFGQTVNIAARLQAKAESSEIVTCAAIAERAEREGVLHGMRAGDRFEASLKGLASPVACVRLRLADDDASRG